MFLDANRLMDAAGWAYDKAINVTQSIPGIGSVEDLARQYQRDTLSIESQISSLINWQCTKTFSTGFITGLGGLITLPVSVPADLSCLFFHQLRMVAAISYLSGNTELNDDKIKTLCILCLCGSTAMDTLKDVGIEIGTQFTKNLIKNISGRTIKQINKAVGFRLVTKFGTKGIINLPKTVPIVGGVIGGFFNFCGTRAVGYTAKKVFYSK